MTGIVFAIPGDISIRSGGYEYDRRVLAGLAERGVEAARCALPPTFPAPSPDDVALCVEAIAGHRRAGDALLIDGLAYGALPEAAIRALGPRIVAICHHPLSLERGLAPERAAALLDSERRALSLAAHVIVTSAHTRGLLVRDFGLAVEKISVAPPGVDPAPRARGSGAATTLLVVGAIIPRKAHDMLVEALAGLVDLDWRLRIVGSVSHAPAAARALEGLIAAKGLEARIEISGEIASEELAEVYDRADLFVSASHYEGYGMALAEAMAHGLPIVASTGGAAAETVPEGAALTCRPGDVVALRDALREAIDDRALRVGLAEASWRAGQGLPRWDETVRVVAHVAAEVGASGA
jgi:glycosyltransferase involved in cell wall biosynthesis